MSNERKPLLMRVLEAMQEADNYYVSPDQAQVAIALVRVEVLEEAAKVAERAARYPVGAGDGGTYVTGTAIDAAAAIRALGEK